MSLRRYPEYVSSGVEWLGQVPAHWRLDRLKRSVSSCKNGVWGDEPRQDDNDIPCVRVADFDRQALRVELSEPTLRNVLQKERIDRILVRGDLLLEKSGGGELQPVGCVVLYDDPRPAVCSNFVARMRMAQGMNPSYWRYVHAAAYAARLNTRSIKQTSGIQNLDQQQYLDERAPFPPQDEQVRVASFLDRETAKIDALVTGQQRLIELLKEKREAVISNAVAKGLNPDASMKPSGIWWLGDVPEHWRLGPLKQFCDDITDGAHISPETENGVYPFISTKDVGDNSIDFENCLRTSASSFEYLVRNRCRPVSGDVLFSKDGTIGRTIVVSDDLEFVVASSLIIIRPSNLALEPRFLHFLCQSRSTAAQVETFVKGAGLPRLSIQSLRRVVGAIPPKHEQKAIVAFLECETEKYDALAAEAERAIELLQERRAALISAAVTGKIDLRGLVNTEGP